MKREIGSEAGNAKMRLLRSRLRSFDTTDAHKRCQRLPVPRMRAVPLANLACIPLGNSECLLDVEHGCFCEQRLNLTLEQVRGKPCWLIRFLPGMLGQRIRTGLDCSFLLSRWPVRSQAADSCRVEHVLAGSTDGTTSALATPIFDRFPAAWTKML